MKIYKRIFKGSTLNYIGRSIDKLVKCDPCPVGERWSANINMHINNRAGLTQNRNIK